MLLIWRKKEELFFRDVELPVSEKQSSASTENIVEGVAELFVLPFYRLDKIKIIVADVVDKNIGIVMI